MPGKFYLECLLKQQYTTFRSQLYNLLKHPKGRHYAKQQLLMATLVKVAKGGTYLCKIDELFTATVL